MKDIYKMAIKLMTQVWETDVSGNEQSVLLCLADYANDDGVCWPGIDRVAWKVGISERTVRRMIDGLEERGAVEKQRRFGSSTVYTLHLDKLPAKAPFIPRIGQNDRIDTERRKPDTGDRMIRTQLRPDDSDTATTDKPSGNPLERTVSSAAAPPVASVDEEEAFEAGALPGGETPPPTPSPKEAGAISAEVNRYWAAYKTAAGLTALQAKQQQGKARGQLRAVLGDPEARAGITVEAFAAQATKTRDRLAARGQLQYLSPHEVFTDLANATAKQENAGTQRDRMAALIRVYEAWKWNRERTKLWVGSDERRAQLRSDIESSLTAALGDTPDLTPRGFLHALEWRWYLEPVGEQRPCTPRDLRWAVQAWVRDGRPGRNPGMALYQRGNELETIVDQIERLTEQER